MIMEEMEKNRPEGGKNHGRRRRHGKHRGHGNGGNAQQPQAAGQSAPVVQQGKQQPQQSQQNKPVQPNKPQQKPQQKPVQPQNQQGKKNKQGNAQGGQNSGNPQGKQQPQQNKPQSGQNNHQNSQKNNQKNNQQGKKNNQKQENQNRKDTYVYALDGNLYINLTNKCSNGRDFCVRNERASYYGHYLWLQKGEPTAEKVIAAINAQGDLKKFKEIVFCGFGEPTYRMAEIIAVCDYVHEKGLPTRLNTNGQGNLINKRDIVPELVDKIDLVNVSLNASCYEKYQKICRSQFREAGFDSMIEFAKACKRKGINVRFSIVDCIGEEEVEACKRLAASTGVPLYVRDYIADS